MIRFLSLALFAITAGTPALAGFPNDARVEISIAAPSISEPGQVDETVRWAREELLKTLASHPGIKPEIIAESSDLADTASRVAQGTPAQITVQALPGGIRGWLSRHYRVSFTLVRGLANSAVVSWGLVVSKDVPLLAALPVGLAAGGMSAGFQFHNQRYQEWLLHAKTALGRVWRNYVVNVGYFGIAKIAAALAGISAGTEPTGVFLSVFKTAFLSTAAQGPWSLSVAERAGMAAKRTPERARHIRFLNDLKILTISFVSVGISIADLVGVPHADLALLGMAGTGAVNYAWTRFRSKRACAELLRP